MGFRYLKDTFKIVINGPDANRRERVLPNTLSISFEGLVAQELLEELSQSVRGGSQGGAQVVVLSYFLFVVAGCRIGWCCVS